MLSILFWNKICLKFQLVFKAEELKKHKISKSLNQQTTGMKGYCLCAQGISRESGKIKGGPAGEGEMGEG
jgi:hypothetical protein